MLLKIFYHTFSYNKDIIYMYICTLNLSYTSKHQTFKSPFTPFFTIQYSKCLVTSKERFLFSDKRFSRFFINMDMFKYQLQILLSSNIFNMKTTNWKNTTTRKTISFNSLKQFFFPSCRYIYMHFIAAKI